VTHDDQDPIRGGSTEGNWDRRGAEPDPERSQGVTERVDARHYGDPDDERPAHVEPPHADESGETNGSQFVRCSRCGGREMIAVPRDDARPALWCADCEEPVAYGDESDERPASHGGQAYANR